MSHQIIINGIVVRPPHNGPDFAPTHAPNISGETTVEIHATITPAHGLNIAQENAILARVRRIIAKIGEAD